MDNDSINDFVLRRLRRLRLKQGLLMRVAAERAGIPLGSYTCLESRRYRLSLDNLFRILHALGAGIGEVWPGGKPPSGGLHVGSGYVAQHLRLAAQSESPLRPTLDDVLEVVCDAYQISLGALCSGRRDYPLGEARAIAALLTAETHHLRLVALAERFGNDVSSCSHGAHRIRDKLCQDRVLQQRLSDIRLTLLERRD